MKLLLLASSLLLLSGLAPAAAQDNDSPIFSNSDTLGTYDPWKTASYGAGQAEKPGHSD